MINHTFIMDILSGIRKNKTRNAFFIDGQFYTYQTFAERISGIMKFIEQYTKQSSQCIGIIEEDNIETYASLLAVLLSGNTYVILNPNNPISRNLTIIESTDIHLILQTSDKSYFSSPLNNINITCTKQLIACDNSDNFIKLPDENSLAYIIFTSGSTGVPKGVPISHRNLNAFYTAYSALHFNLNEEDRMLQMFDLCFDVSVVSILYPLTLGACIYTVPQNGVKYTQVYQLLEDEELSFATIAPSLLSYLYPYFKEINLPKLKYLILTAEASHWDLLSQFILCAPNAEFINLYGPTEATIYCSSYRINPRKTATYNGLVAIGKVFENIQFKIIDEALQEVGIGEKGELCIAGSQLMDGYWKDPQKNKEVFVSLSCNDVPTRFYRTGDICFVDSKACIHYCCRKDNQVQIQGFRVELSEIEHAVKQYHKKGNNIVLAKSNPFGNQELHLFLEKFENNDQNLIGFLKEKLPSYMCPKQIHNIEELPLNSSGKIDRKKLLSLI